MTAIQTGLFAPPVRAVEGSWTKRRYQIDCADAILNGWKTMRMVLAEMATGTGKTKTAVEGVIARILATEPRANVLWLAHLNVLTGDAVDIIADALGEPVALEQGKSHWTSERVCVGSIATLYNKKRLAAVAPRVTHVIYDECHHAAGKANTAVLKAMPKARVAGFSATLRRHDDVSLRHAGFEKVVYQYPLFTIVRKSGYAVEGAIPQGYLVPFKTKAVRIPGLSFGHLTRKEFTDEIVGEIIGEKSLLASICKAVLAEAGERVAISFWPTVKVAYLATAMFNELRHGYAVAIDCKMEAKSADASLKLKNDAIKDFKSGRFRHACNVRVLSEGFDHPEISCVVNCAPTDSIPAVLQFYGRGTRNVCKVDKYDTAAERRAAIAASIKPDLLILDLVGSHGKLKLVSAIDALGGDADPDEVEAAKKAAEERQISPDDAMKLGKERAAEERRKKAEAHARAKHVPVTFGEVNPFEVLGIATPTRQQDAEPEPPASREQIAYLKFSGIDVPDETPRSVALQLRRQVEMRKRKHLASFRQVALLAKADVNARSMYGKNASKLIAFLDAEQARDRKPWRKLSKDEVGRIIKGES